MALGPTPNQKRKKMVPQLLLLLVWGFVVLEGMERADCWTLPLLFRFEIPDAWMEEATRH